MPCILYVPRRQCVGFSRGSEILQCQSKNRYRLTASKLPLLSEGVGGGGGLACNSNIRVVSMQTKLDVLNY